AHRHFERTTHDLDTRVLVFVVEFQVVERRNRIDQRHTTTGDDTLFNRCTSRAQGVLNAVFLLFQFGLGCRTDADHRDTTAEFRQTFLQFLAVIVAGAEFDFLADLLDTTLDGSFVARAVHNRGFVLGRHDLRRTSEVLQGDGFELAPGLFADDQTAREGGDVAEHGFTTITKAGGFHCQYVEHTTQLVEHQRCQRLAVYVFGNDDNVALADLYQLFQQRHDVLRRADLLVIDQDVRLFNDGFHRLRVGD